MCDILVFSGAVMGSRGVLIIAHRGASAEAPENTAAAIRRAWQVGADMVELDVQVTADDRLVIFHDDRLDRITGVRGRLIRQRWTDLQQLDCGSWFASRFADERMPLLSRALRSVPSTKRVNLELKRTQKPSVLITGVVRALRATGRVRRALISSFDMELLARLRRAHRQAAIALICRRRPRVALRRAVRLGCRAWHPHASLVTPALVREAHAAGLRVHAWTVDEPAQAHRLLRLGVDGVFTNDPARLRRGVR